MTTGVVRPGVEVAGARVLNPEEFAVLCAGGDVLVSKGGRPAVIARLDHGGRRVIIKVWRRDRISAGLQAYHRRFRRALVRLREVGITVPRYLGHGRVRGTGDRYVVYDWLEGEPVRGRLEAVGVARLAALVANLHERGVYFRGLHLANVIETSEGSLALIDVQDIRFRRRALSWRLRKRNLGILCAHPRDLRELGDGRWQALVEAYACRVGLDEAAGRRLVAAVARQIRRRSARRAARRARRGLAPFEP